MNTEKKIVVLAVVVSLVITSFLILYTVVESEETGTLLDNNDKVTSYDYVSGATIVPGDYLEPTFNDITNDYRPMYEGLSEEQYGYFFSELPEFKEDFFTIAQLVYDGKITDYSRLSEDYWKQPEFYPGWFASMPEAYINNDPNRWTPEGYGCYPTIKEVEATVGSNIIVNTYFKSGYGTESYQGLVVKPIFPTVAKDLLGNTLFENPVDVTNYIDIRIENPDDIIYEGFKDRLVSNNVREEDWFVIFKPTYQLLRDKYGDIVGEKGFPDDWVRVVDLAVDISSSAPKGTYVIALDIEPPCFEINQEFYFSTDHEYYGASYHPSGYFHRTEIPHFQLVLKVV